VKGGFATKVAVGRRYWVGRFHRFAEMDEDLIHCSREKVKWVVIQRMPVQETNARGGREGHD